MKLLLDARRINAEFLGGVGIYVDQLIHYFIKRKNKCFLLISKNKTLPKFYSNNPLISLIPLGKTYANCRERYLEEKKLPSIIRKIKPDIFHAMDNTGAPTKVLTKNIVTIHDLIPLVLGEYMNKDDQKEYLKAIKSTVQNADAIISISEFTKNEIVKYLKVKEEKIKVIHNGYNLGKTLAAPEFNKLCSHFKISKPYIIYTGGLGPRKNILRLIKAFSLAKQKIGKEIQLILTGKIKKNILKEIAEYKNLIKSKKLDSSVVFTDYLNVSELDTLRKNAIIAVYPSLYEGFGLPVIEAMALGVPVIASNTTSIPEVAGDAAILVNPESTGEIAKNIIKLFSNAGLRKKLMKKGLKNIKRFSWEKTARETLELYKTI